MELEEELLRFLKKYNVKYWMEKDEDSGSNGEFEIVSEKEYAKRKEECEDDFSEEEKQVDDMTNRFENVELNEEEGAFNFEIPLLEKSREWNRGLNVVMNLSAYSIDPNYVTPEERVMRDLLSSPDPAISFMGFVGLS